jgi:putative membrane-bound dehydrogenase-like protein
MSFVFLLMVAQIVPAADAPQPLPPEESLKRFRVPDGFELRLVAAEPLLADSTGICFDADGRLFACELHGYNLDGHYDIQELNKSGKLDMEVRRIPASPEAIRRAEAETYGTVKLLEDTDGDGRMDRARVWADRLPPCYGMVPWRDGVIVLCAPKIVYLADRDGDGTAEVRDVLLEGFGVGEVWTRISNPRWGLDNRIYAVMGHGSGGTITGPRLREPVKLGDQDFCFAPDGGALEPITGGTGGFGHALTDWGERFLNTNSNHARFAVPLPQRYLARNPFVAAPPGVADASNYFEIFPISQPDPWRLARSRRPEWVKFYGAHEARANGNFTSACGQTIYRAAAFGPEYRGNHFSCDPAQNLVHRCLIERDGAGFRVRRAPGEERTEFLASTEQWFRPNYLCVGPDGALYIVDMYREIIEDYSAIPRYLQQQYGLIAGHDRGRIWRLQARSAPSPRRPALRRATTAQLVALLGDDDAWWRETAQRLLVERDDRSALDPLRALARRPSNSFARLHALYTLDGLGGLEASDVRAALDDASYGVRVHALRLAERWLDADLFERAAALSDDPDPSVRLQAALTLGQSRRPEATAALANLARRHGEDRWMRAAILSSAVESAPSLLSALRKEPKAASWVNPLSSIIGARRDPAEIGGLLASLRSDPRADALEGLNAGLEHGADDVPLEHEAQEALVRLIDAPDAAVRRTAFKTLKLLKLDDAAPVRAAFERAADTALDPERPVEERRAALAVLANAPPDWLDAVAELLEPDQPPAIQQATVEAMAASDDLSTARLMLRGWKGYSPKLQEAVLAAMLARADRLPLLLAAIESRTVPATAPTGIQRARLLEHPDPAVRARAAALLAPAPRDEQTFKRYLTAWAAGTADPDRGAEVYKNLCGKCHAIKGEGAHVGPDLASVTGRADETLLRDILFPNDQITAGYRAYLIETRAGESLIGTLADESATSITLRREGGLTVTILRRDIARLTASDLSMMPDNIEKLITPQQAADVIAYLRRALGPVQPTRLMLFDEEPDFAERLTEGDGTAVVDASDPFAGARALVVTPPQRFSPRIGGWSFPIRERPGAGEYRYLRLAWKAPEAEGVMVELAADGQWPPAESASRRYYAGSNTTGWQARQVSPNAPPDWTVVTCDLWADNGAFTLTGIAPTAMGGTARFDRIELLRSLD